ncbi:hypothetical protein [Frankia sp. AgB32]|uniref:hypothetical protein n=1 Tax=Frankia sp. AgB32 TaxID=631119 RepID=UPI00200FF088|nr:hypothetical protein [Frankia sp. AgB32]MCK9894371.1 hypothetical protein [Frankia sp. AgB32]
MSDVPQAPHGEEGDARPVSLIGARLPTAASRSQRLSDHENQYGPGGAPASDDTESSLYPRSGRRRHRRRAESEAPEPPDEAWQSEAFHLDDATSTNESDAERASAAEVTSGSRAGAAGGAKSDDAAAQNPAGGGRTRRTGRPAAIAPRGQGESARHRASTGTADQTGSPRSTPADTPPTTAAQPAPNTQRTRPPRASAPPRPSAAQPTPAVQPTPATPATPASGVGGDGASLRATEPPSDPGITVGDPSKAIQKSSADPSTAAAPLAATEIVAIGDSITVTGSIAAASPVEPTQSSRPTPTDPLTGPVSFPHLEKDEREPTRALLPNQPETSTRDQDSAAAAPPVPVSPTHSRLPAVAPPSADPHPAPPLAPDVPLDPLARQTPAPGSPLPASRPSPPVRTPAPTGKPAAIRPDQPAAEPRSWRGGRDLEPREEIPVRLSARDRARIPLPGSWRIAVTSLFPYSGTTTLAGVIGLTLTGMRAHPVLAVDLWPGEPAEPVATSPSSADEDEPRGDPLTSRVGSAGTTNIADVLAHQAGDGAATELRLMIAGQRGGGARDLDVLPLRTDAGRFAQPPRRDGAPAEPDVPVLAGADQHVAPGGLRSVLGLLAHSYPLVLVDAPTEAPLTDVAVAAADLVVLVTLATAADLEATIMRLRAFREAAGDGPAGDGAPPIVAAIVAPRRGRPSPRTRAAAARLGRQVEALVRIPYDPRLDPSRHTPVRIPRLRRRTRRAYLRLTAAAVENLFILAKAEVGASGKTREGPAGASSGAIRPITTRTQSGATSGPPATTRDHDASIGVSFGDLRSPTAPSRIAGPDRPGEPRP